MQIKSQRFGKVEIADDALLNFPAGIIGFPEERRFALIPHKGSSCLGWLQSTKTEELAFPVVSAHAFGEKYPDFSLDDAARAASIGEPTEDFAVLVVLSAPRGQPATVNLLAPIVVNAQTRQGAQVILDGSRFSTRELFVLPRGAQAEPSPIATALAG